MRHLPVHPAAALVALALVAAACAPGGPGGGTQGAATAPPVASASAAAGQPSVVPVIIGQHDRGPARFVFTFLDADGNLPAAAPDRTAHVAFIAPGETEPGPAVPAEFAWAIEGSRGEYIAATEFPAAGEWKVIFITESPTSAQEAIGVSFDVQEDLPTVDIGDAAPSSDTPTAADVGGELDRISTDTNPDPSFYELSVADALEQGRPFVLVFATPAFCQSAQCGPTLERVKAAAAGAPEDIAFINVEPYQVEYVEGRLQPVLDANNQLQANQWVDQWGILSEPWVFAVDGTGIVRGSYEGIATETELETVFEAISGT
jgi:hypothetical protein